MSLLTVPARNSSAPQLRSRLALRGAYHLACVAGPDRGAVIPLIDGTTIGSTTTELADPTVLAHHAEVTVTSNPTHRERRPGRLVGFLREVPEVAASSGPRNLFGGAVPPGTVPLVTGRKLSLGLNLWQVRARPRNLQWPEAVGDRKKPSWKQFLPLVFILFFVVRWGGRIPITIWVSVGIVATSAGVAWWWWRSRRRSPTYRDAGALLLISFSKAQRGEGEKSPTRPAAYPKLWLRSRGRRTLQTSAGTTVGVVGNRADASWLGAQFLALYPRNCRVICTDSGPYGNLSFYPSLLSDEVPLWTIAWSTQEEDLPTDCLLVVDGEGEAGEVWSDKWLEMHESDMSAANHLPAAVDSAQFLLPQTVEEIGTQWDAFTYAWTVPVGVGFNAEKEIETVNFDLLVDGPHALFVGGTGSGKSVALRTWLISLCLRVPPHALRLVLVDFKGGAGLAELNHLPHVEQSVTDLDPAGTTWLLRRLHHVIQERKSLLRSAGYSDLKDWERDPTGPLPPPRLLVVIDEFQALADDNPHFLGTLSRLAAQGRSLGFHLVLSSQRPGTALSSQLRDMLDLRITLRCTEAQTSRQVRGDDLGAQLPRLPGRALWNETELHFAALDAPAELPGFDAAPHTVWPEALPSPSGPFPEISTTKEHQIFLGWQESPDHLGPHTELWWNGEPLLLAAPPGPNTALVELAQLWVWNLALATDRPPSRVGVGPSPSPAENTAETVHIGWEADLAPHQVEEIARCWTRAALADNTLLLVVEPQAILQEFGAQGLGAEGEQLWTQILQRARAGNIHLLVIDTRGSARCADIPRKLLFAQSEADWESSGLWRLGAPQGRASIADFSRDEATSVDFSRAWATGWDGPDRPWQSAPRNFHQTPETVPVSEPLPTQILPLDTHFSGTMVTVMGFQEISLKKESLTILTPHSRSADPSDSKKTVMPLDRWMQVLSAPKGPVLIENSTVDILRFLSQRQPNLGSWIRSLHSLPPNSGLLVDTRNVSVILGVDRALSS